MTSRHRTTSTSRKDSYNLWRPSDSDSDRPRQTMATTQRHNVEQGGVSAEPARKHHSRRADTADLLDPSLATYTRPRHKSSSKDRSSAAQAASYYAVPPSPNPSVQYQTQDAYRDLRDYLKKKSDKRSPRSHEKALTGDEAKPSRSGHPSGSRSAYPTSATNIQPSTLSQYYAAPSATRDPTSSSRHHRDREKDREKSSSRDPANAKHREPTGEKSEHREHRKRKEKEGDKERSKDKERRREKDRQEEHEVRVAAELRPLDNASIYQGYAQPSATVQRSADRNATYSEYRAHSTQPQPHAYAPTPTQATQPWGGLTAAGRGAAAYATDPAYPYASDKDDPPLPIPPPERRRERTSSKPHRSHRPKVSSQQAGQDSGISSSEQEHSVMERPRTVDRQYANREQASILQRGYSSGPSGSENEKAPTIQKERRKHKTHGESSRHRSKHTTADAQAPPGPTSSQEIASAWYQRHSFMKTSAPVNDTSEPKSSTYPNGISNPAGVTQTSVHPSGKATSSVGLNTSQRSAPRIVSIRAGQGPADPQVSSMLPKIHSGTTPSRQADPLPAYYNQQPAARLQELLQQPASAHHHSTAYGEPSSAYTNPTGAPGPHPVGLSRQGETNGATSQATHGHHLPTSNNVVRPPSMFLSVESNTSRMATVGQGAGRLQIPDPRLRSTPAPAAHSTPYATATAQPGYHSTTQYADADPHRQPAPAKVPAYDLSNRFPLNEDAPAPRPPAQPSNVSPKRGLTYPGASAPAPLPTVHANPTNYHANGGYDPRSPKPPSVSTIIPDASRLQPHASGSPAVVGHAVSTGSSANTPKHSPSTRLHSSHRNGSNDTIAHGLTKPSPSNSAQQHLPHRTSATNLQPPALSRYENTTPRQPNGSSTYPDIARYRSPAPSGYPNAQATTSTPNVAASTSQGYSTQTPGTAYEQYGRATNTSSQTAYPAQAAALQPQVRSGQSMDYERVPPRTAPSPAPTVRPPRLTSVSSPPAKTPAPLHSAPPVPTRHQTFPAPAPTPSTTPFPAHSRTSSDPQYAGRVPGGGYASTSLPTRGYGPSRTMPSPAPQADVLLTPSSLAPSMLPQVAPTVPLSRTTSKSTTKEKKKGFFGISLFRSRSSPPKEREVDAPLPSAAIREKRQRNNSQPSQPQAHLQASHVTAKPPTAHAAPQVAVAAAVSIPAQSQHTRGYSTGAVPIAAPTPVPAAHGQRSTNGKMFTPFRLLSRRHRTMSTASVEAVDGTVLNAMLTGGDSTRSSTAGRPSPPLRDPMMAAQEWRNKEENEQQGRGTLRRRRPGVTFDVREEIPDEGRGPMQKSLRQNVQNLPPGVAAQVQAQAQAQSQAQAQVHAHAHAHVPMPARQATA